VCQFSAHIYWLSLCCLLSERECYVLDASQEMKHGENVMQQRASYQLSDVGSASTNQLHVNADDVDTRELYADFPTDDCHYIADCSDSAMCYADHYDDNYQVYSCH